YDFITEETLAYFTPRLIQAPQDVDFALRYVKAEAKTRADQEKVLAALRFKCDVLWTQLDALYLAYVDPGLIPPERLMLPDEQAVEILKLVDGKANVDTIVDALAAKFNAPREEIAGDVT